MTLENFVSSLASIRLPNVFNPYADTCVVHDYPDAAKLRCENLTSLLTAIQNLNVDTIWMGRDLGYRGGRRTGLALTDEKHLPEMGRVYPGIMARRTTTGTEISERTASEIWAVLFLLKKPPLLWNVFPFHPYEDENQFTNRKFSTKELNEVHEINFSLIRWLGIKRIVSIGQDAASYGRKFGVSVESVRHPSYGGVTEFRAGISQLHGIDVQKKKNVSKQVDLF